MKSPCYDYKNRKDCPNRKIGCAIDCEKWKEFTKYKEEMRKKISDAKETEYQIRKLNFRGY